MPDRFGPYREALVLEELLLRVLLLPQSANAAGRALRPLLTGQDKERTQVAVKLRPLMAAGMPVLPRHPPERGPISHLTVPSCPQALFAHPGSARS